MTSQAGDKDNGDTVQNMRLGRFQSGILLLNQATGQAVDVY